MGEWRQEKDISYSKIKTFLNELEDDENIDAESCKIIPYRFEKYKTAYEVTKYRVLYKKIKE